MQEYRVTPRRAKPSSPTLQIGSPDPPQLIELHVDLSEGKIQQFLITIENVELGRVMQIRRVARDTNGELRIGINSSALVPGDYDIAIEGYNWRGSTSPVGWIRLGLR
jgi:ribosomal protein L5